MAHQVESVTTHRPDLEGSPGQSGSLPFEGSSLARQTWAGIAVAYGTYTSPLRPSRADLEIVQQAVRDWSCAYPGQTMRALLLGMTPDIARLDWPSGSTLVGVDSSMGVIRAIWPRDVPARHWAACGNWLALPLRRRSCDIVVGDGSLNAFRFPDGWRAVASTIRDVLADNGTLVVRCYLRPEEPESPDHVIQDLFGRGIADINHFKFRLFLALQQSTESGTPVREVYQFLRSRVDAYVLNSMPGWSEAAIGGFELWRNAETVYTFPTLAELRDVLGPYFHEHAVVYPSYTLGNVCPTLLLKPGSP